MLNKTENWKEERKTIAVSKMTEELRDQKTRRGLEQQRQWSRISNKKTAEEDRVRRINKNQKFQFENQNYWKKSKIIS